LSKRRADGPAVKRKPQRPGQKKPVKRRLLTVLKWLLIVGLVVTLTGIGAFYYAYTQTTIPNPNADFQTETTKVYYADGKTELGQFATQNRESIAYSEMPDNIKQAVVAAEDQSFWTNQGIDPKGILRAAFSNARGNSTQGASTITQQYVKILYLTQERSLQRKAKEAFLSLKLQREQSKQEILEGYLNTIYFGRGAYGIQAAAMAYFDVPAKDLNLKQAAVLASVLNDPNDLDPSEGKDAKAALKERYAYVLGAMAETGDITAEEAAQASETLPKFPKIQADSQYGGQKGHMLRMVRSELRQMGYSEEAIDGGGLRVTTTFTPEAMAAAEAGVLAQKPEGFGDKELHVAAATVEPGTGALLGFYGGQDYLDSQINWAEAGGMVGSTFKPFTLATAIKEGFSLEDTFEGNSPYEFPDGLEVRNEGGGDGNDYGSNVDATYALEESINTAFVDMSASIPDGPEKIFETANAMGIPPAKATKRYPGIPKVSRDLSPDDALITLGRARISPINMANAYATIANGGVRANVHVIKKVEDRTGEDPKVYDVVNTDALDPDITADVSYAMQQVVQNGTGQAALELGWPAAGKTGTATNDKDQVS
jgi:membrane peptidoglycan carboxypeptidase